MSESKRVDVMKILGMLFVSFFSFIHIYFSSNTGYAYFGQDLGTKRIINIVRLRRLEQLKKERSSEEKKSEGEKGCGIRRKRGKDQGEREKENKPNIVGTLCHHYLLLLLLHHLLSHPTTTTINLTTSNQEDIVSFYSLSFAE
jgi:hypothetical protein